MINKDEDKTSAFGSSGIDEVEWRTVCFPFFNSMSCDFGWKDISTSFFFNIQCPTRCDLSSVPSETNTSFIYAGNLKACFSAFSQAALK